MVNQIMVIWMEMDLLEKIGGMDMMMMEMGLLMRIIFMQMG